MKVFEVARLVGRDHSIVVEVMFLIQERFKLLGGRFELLFFEAENHR